MTVQLNGRWDASKFFEHLCATNRLARQEGFTFCRVSGLDGFEEAVNEAQTQTAFVCVSDIADGYTELNNTPRTRRIKTVFFAMRHAAEDMAARAECMEIMRELFRQFMSRLFLEKVKLEQNCIYLDPRISFNEIDRYFFNGAAGAYFQIAVDVYTDLRHNPDEWTDDYNDSPYVYMPSNYDIWLIESVNTIHTVKVIREYTSLGIVEAKNLVDKCPSLIKSDISSNLASEIEAKFISIDATVKIVRHGRKP